MNYSICFQIPNGRVDPRLAGNSSYARMGKARLTERNKRDAFNLTKACLNGVDPEEFLTNCGEYELTQAFPLTLVCRRVYTGKAHVYDDDNIRMAFKAFRDGICAALGIVDDPAHLTGQYPQVRKNRPLIGCYLEFEMIPAWAANEVKKAG